MADPNEQAVHLFCLRLSRKLVSLVEPCLPPGGKTQALTDFYEVIRLDLERHERTRREVASGTAV